MVVGTRNLALFNCKKDKHGEAQEHTMEKQRREVEKKRKAEEKRKRRRNKKERTDDRTIAELPSDDDRWY